MLGRLEIHTKYEAIEAADEKIKKKRQQSWGSFVSESLPMNNEDEDEGAEVMV